MELKQCKTAVVAKEEDERESEAWWLSDEILEEILMRLPNSKHAFELKLVCKRWNSILSNHHFHGRAAAFHRHNPNGGGCSFTLVFQWELVSVAVENNACVVRPLYLDPSLSSSSQELIKIGASCNDLLVVENVNKKNQYYVANVQTHNWIALPPAPSISANIPLGASFKVGLLCHYGSSFTFKVIRIFYVNTNTVDIDQTLPVAGVDATEFSVHIYSSDSKQWSEYIVDWYPFRFTHYLTKTLIVPHNGMLHWVNGRALLSLDPFHLVFDDDNRLRLNRTVELPEKNFYNDPEIGLFYDFIQGKVSKFVGFGVVRDHLRIITMHIDSGPRRPLLVWQLDESKIDVDVDGPWSLMYNVSISEFPNKELSQQFHFLACHPYEGDVLFVQIFKSIYQINLRTQELRKAKQGKPYQKYCYLSNVLPPLLHQWLPTQLTSPL